MGPVDSAAPAAGAFSEPVPRPHRTDLAPSAPPAGGRDRGGGAPLLPGMLLVDAGAGVAGVPGVELRGASAPARVARISRYPDSPNRIVAQASSLPSSPAARMATPQGRAGKMAATHGARGTFLVMPRKTVRQGLDSPGPGASMKTR